MEPQSEEGDNSISPSENPSQCTSRGKRLKSNVWEHMTRDVKDDGTKAICNYCKQILGANAKDAIKFCYTRLFGETYAKEMVGKIKATLFELVDEYKRFVGTSESGPSGRNNQADGNNSALASSRSKKVSINAAEDELFDFLIQEVRTTDKSELEAYLNVEEIDILVFWKKKSQRAPALSALARDILSIPISSVPSESAFSLGKKMITPCRSSLRSSTIEALACFEDWLRVKGFEAGTSSMLKIGVDVDDDVEDEEDDSVVTEIRRKLHEESLDAFTCVFLVVNL